MVLNPGVPIACGAGRQGRSPVRDEEMRLVCPAEQGLSQAPTDFPKRPCWVVLGSRPARDISAYPQIPVCIGSLPTVTVGVTYCILSEPQG